jgi:hypothetical protein
MATPNVVNLAAKLFALDPSLTPVQVIELIKQGATTRDDGRRQAPHRRKALSGSLAGDEVIEKQLSDRWPFGMRYAMPACMCR